MSHCRCHPGRELGLELGARSSCSHLPASPASSDSALFIPTKAFWPQRAFVDAESGIVRVTPRYSSPVFVKAGSTLPELNKCGANDQLPRGSVVSETKPTPGESFGQRVGSAQSSTPGVSGHLMRKPTGAPGLAVLLLAHM